MKNIHGLCYSVMRRRHTYHSTKEKSEEDGRLLHFFILNKQTNIHEMFAE